MVATWKSGKTHSFEARQINNTFIIDIMRIWRLERTWKDILRFFFFCKINRRIFLSCSCRQRVWFSAHFPLANLFHVINNSDGSIFSRPESDQLDISHWLTHYRLPPRFLDGSMHLYKRLCPSDRRSVHQSVRHKILFLLEMRKYDQKRVNICHSLNMHCTGALSKRSFVCVCQSVIWSLSVLGSPSTRWMHRCLPVRLVS